MVKNTYIRTNLLFHEKLTVVQSETNIRAICELKAWQLPVSKKYPLGLKYSLFCVDFLTRQVIIGFDNHYPKGPHKHIDNREVHYSYSSLDQLVEDFWNDLEERSFYR